MWSNPAISIANRAPMGMWTYHVSDNEASPERTHVDYCPWQLFSTQNHRIMESHGPGLCYDGGEKTYRADDVCREKARALKAAFLPLKSLKKPKKTSLF